MDAPLQLISDTGVALRREMLTMGVTDRDLRASVRYGVLRRIRQGAYTVPRMWDRATDAERHRLRCVAVSRAFGPRVALTHTSSLVMQGVPVWGADLRCVHLTRLDGGANRSEAGVVHHDGQLDETDLIETEAGILVTCAPRAVIEHCSINTVESGLVSADAAAHVGMCTRDELAARLESMTRWPGTQRLQIVVRLVDGRAESPGETRSRYLCWRHGLPAPELQFEVYDAHGRLIGTTDLAWPAHRLLGEFDGRMKYGRFLRPGQTPGDAVFAEKRREDLLREVTGWSMIRLVWDDLANGSYTADRIRKLMLLAA